MMKISKPDNSFDFEAVAKSKGYLKARLILKQLTADQKEKDISKAGINDPYLVIREKLKAEDDLKLSKTIGLTSSESHLEKILSLGTKNNKNNQNNKNNKNHKNNENSKLISSEKSEKSAESRESEKSEQYEKLDEETNSSFHSTLLSEDGALFMANTVQTCIPIAFGDTLALQTAFIKIIKCPGNQFKYLTPKLIPQLSTYHIRYVQDINLSNNKLRNMPSEIGNLVHLHTMDLSGNMLSELPASIVKLKVLKDINISNNAFNTLPPEFAQQTSLTRLNISSNAMSSIPPCIVKLLKLKYLDISKNYLQHLAVMPLSLLRPKDLWKRMLSEEDGRFVYIHMLTREKVDHISSYTGIGTSEASDLHVFQPAGSIAYNRRRIWLSVNKIYEWETVLDEASTWIYYRNNVSGETQWDLPDALDLMGCLKKLEILNLQNNSLKILSNSFTQLTSLKKLNVTENHIHSLPTHIGKMSSITVLDLNGNEIKNLPISILNCKSLTHLNVQGNSLLKLPDLIGTMPNLFKLDVSWNKIVNVPLSIGFSKSLKELLLGENPLLDPPLSESIKGVEHVMWYLRNRLHVVNRGMPPMMKYHNMGIQEEATLLLPEVKNYMAGMIKAAEVSGFLNLQLMNFKYIPKEVIAMKKLKRLRFDCNRHLNLRLGIPEEFKDLTLLSFKSCRLTYIPETIDNLKKIDKLYLEENLIDFFPISFSSLTTLTVLDLSKNELYCLPEEIGNLAQLKNLNVQSNYLEGLPKSMQYLQELEIFNASSNHLRELPIEISYMKKLKKIILQRNLLVRLPILFGTMASVIELRIGYNRLEMLPEEMFLDPDGLANTLRIFECCENNIQELPISTYNLHPDCRFDAGFNPLISPPFEILKDGLKGIQEYLRIRLIRRNELIDLMADQDFEFVMDRSHPVAADVLEDGIGFLTPLDCASFDKSTQEYLNGEYYNCPVTGPELVSRLATLRETREAELYLTIIKIFYKVIEKIVKDKDKNFGSAVLTRVFRPWGRNTESVECWALSLHCLLRDNPVNIYNPNGRKSVFSLIDNAMPLMPFPFTVDLLKDALRLYVTPYGQIADTEPVKFPQCDCLQDKSNPPVAFKHLLPCEKPAVVLCIAIYTEEETVRRDLEEHELFDIFYELELDICAWLQTAEGIRCLNTECTKRMAMDVSDIKVRETLILSEQVKLRESRMKKVGVMRKIKMYRAGDPHYMHGISDDQAALGLQEKADDEVNKHSSRLSTINLSIDRLTLRTKYTPIVQRNLASEDLLKKYAFIVYTAALLPLRKFAAQKGLNRPWDGLNGAAFVDWEKRFHRGNKSTLNLNNSSLSIFNSIPVVEVSDDDDDEDDGKTVQSYNPSHSMLKIKSVHQSLELSREAGTLVLSTMRANSEKMKINNKNHVTDMTPAVAVEEDDDDEQILEPEFNWEETALMNIYICPMYDHYKLIQQSIFGASTSKKIKN